MKALRSIMFLLGTVGLVWTFALADEYDYTATMAEPDEKSSPDAKPDKDKKEKKKDFPEFKEVVTEDFEKVPIPTYASSAYYTLYYNKKTDELLAQIPSKLIDTNFMISNSITAGPMIAGWMWDDMVVRWQRRDKKMVLLQPDLRNEAKKDKAITDAVSRTYTDKILKTVAIKTVKGSDPVIDLGELFKHDLGKIGRIFGGKLDGSLAKWTKHKCFEQNLVLTVESPISDTKPQPFFGSSAEGTLISVNYNISSMPDTGYKPRVADDRIGYFGTVRRDWTKSYESKTLFNRYINRWHLEKVDPSLEMSPPKDPIVFYIEKTVPVRFRKAVKDGILEWNKAFEKCGFIDAMIVRQQTDSRFNELDPEDVTKNFFLWTAVGNGLARGPSRANPLTGQIYDADIVFDDSWVRFPIETHAVFGAKSLSDSTFDPKLRTFLKAHPEFDIVSRRERLMPGYGEDIVATGEIEIDFRMLNERYSRHMCDYGADLRNELSLASAILDAQAYPEIPEEFIRQVVKEVVMHEVGHTLGMFHNFKASSWHSIDEILDKNLTEPIGASVMDYNAFMFHEDKEQQGAFAMTTIGPYDEWVIEYGYRPVGEPYKDEEEMLKAIVDRVAEKGLAYANDYDTGMFDPDPLVNRRDMGDDPMEFARYRIKLVKKLQKNMADWAVDDGESYSRLRKRFNRLLFEVGSASIFAGRYVGGQYFHRDHKGDTNARDPFVMVPAEKQREAMRFVAENVFAEDAFQFEPELLNKLAPGRWAHWGSDDFSGWLDYNLHDSVEMIMRYALLPLFNPFTITRLHEMELRYSEGEEPYTLSEHIRSLTGIVWSELDRAGGRTIADHNPFIHSFRRGLQRAYTEQLIRLIMSTPGRFMPADAHALMRMTCDELHEKVSKAAAKKSIDDVSRAHLLDVERRLKKALDAEFQQY